MLSWLVAEGNVQGFSSREDAAQELLLKRVKPTSPASESARLLQSTPAMLPLPKDKVPLQYPVPFRSYPVHTTEHAATEKR